MLTLHEVAITIKVSESSVRRWIKNGYLKAYKVGQRGQLRIKVEDLERYLNKQVVQVKNTNEQGSVTQNLRIKNEK